MATHTSGTTAMNTRRIAFLVLMLLPLKVAAAELRSGDKIVGTEEILYLGILGKDTETTVTNGYLFVNGAYWDAPYKIQRIGQTVTVNGRLVEDMYHGPVTKKRSHWTSADITYADLAGRAKYLYDEITRVLRSGASMFVWQVKSQKRSYGKALLVACETSAFLDAVLTAVSDTPITAKLSNLATPRMRGLTTKDRREAFIKTCAASQTLQERVREEAARMEERKKQQARKAEERARETVILFRGIVKAFGKDHCELQVNGKTFLRRIGQNVAGWKLLQYDPKTATITFVKKEAIIKASKGRAVTYVAPDTQ